MFDRSNTPGAVRAEDQPLIEVINDARRRYGFSDAAAKQLLDDFTKPIPALRLWVFEVCDPTPRADPFMTNDDLAAFTRAVLTGGQDCSARWADLKPTERRLARRIKRFGQDKRRVWMSAGRPQNVDRSLVLYVIRRIEEAIGVPFRFSRPAPRRSPGGPMLRLAGAALRRLFRIADNDYVGLVSPARYYTPKEIAQTAEWVRRASRTSPAKWPSAWILAARGDVRSELVSKARQENKDQSLGSSGVSLVPPSSWVMSSWVDLREALEAAVAGQRQTPSLLQANLKSGAEPDLIELAKRKMPRFDDPVIEQTRAGLVRQEQQSASAPPRSRPMRLVAERILPEETPAPPPSSMGRTA